MQQTAKSFETPRTGAIGYDSGSMYLLREHPATGPGPRPSPAAPVAFLFAALPALLLAALPAAPARGETLATTLTQSQQSPPRDAGSARSPAPSPGETLAGRPLAEALRALEADGLTILFTSELVRADMKVLGEPAAREPRQILDEILTPHGLEAREGPGGVLVVARTGAPGAPASIEGRVLVRGRREGLTGALVRAVGPIEETGGETDGKIGGEAETRADGSFSLAGLANGRYTLQATAPGYLDQEVDGVRVTAGTPRRVVVELYPRPFHQEEILVLPSRLSLLHEKPDAPFAFSREEIEALPHLGGDVLRPLALLPGTAGNDVTASFSVHGGRRDEVKIVLDGQELYDAFHLQDYDSALSIVPAYSLASASLATGAFPASQGDRMGGVLDLETPEPPAGRHFALGLSAFDALVSSTGSFGGKGGDAPGRWLVTARRGSLDLAGDAIGDEHPAFWDLLAKTELDTRFGRLSAHLLTAADELTIDRTEGEDFERLNNDYGRTYGWLKHQATHGGRLLVETIASWAEIRRDRHSATSEEKGSFELRDRRRLEVLGLSQSWSLRLGRRQSAQWGWEARRYDATFDYFKDLRPEIVILSPQVPHPSPVARFDGSLRGNHFGAWAADRFTVGEKLTAELGLRFDHHGATDDDLLSPRVNLAWRLGEQSVLRAAWGRFFQSQRPYELGVADGETSLRHAERSDHWVVGFESVFSPGEPDSSGAGTAPRRGVGRALGLEALRIELFSREIDNPRTRSENLLEPLNFFQEIEPDRVRITAEESSAEGIEILLRGRPAKRLGWWLSYSLARAEDTLDGKTVPRALDQRHALTVDLDLRLPRNWHLNLAWHYHSGWPTTPIEAVPEGGIAESAEPDDPDEPEEEPGLVPAFGPLNSERLPAYHRLDVRASRRWELARGSLTFFVDVQNLYNRRNLAGFDVSVDPEEGSVELDGEHWPGLFPSLGITWEW